MKLSILVIISLLIFVGYSSSNEVPVNKCQELKWSEEFNANSTREIDTKWLYKKIPADSAKTYLAKQLNEGIDHVIGINEDQRKEMRKKNGEWAEKKWTTLKPRLKKGDKIWLYTTPEKYWKSLLGEEGILVIRECKIIGNIITVQS